MFTNKVVSNQKNALTTQKGKLFSDSKWTNAPTLYEQEEEIGKKYSILHFLQVVDINNLSGQILRSYALNLQSNYKPHHSVIQHIKFGHMGFFNLHPTHGRHALFHFIDTEMWV